MAHFLGSVIVLEQQGMVQVLGKLLTQIAKSQQILLHGKFVEAIAWTYAVTSRCRSKPIISTDQQYWCLDWRQKDDEGLEGEGIITCPSFVALSPSSCRAATEETHGSQNKWVGSLNL